MNLSEAQALAEIESEHRLAQERAEGVAVGNIEAYRLEQKGWFEWYRVIFGDEFVDAFGESHHAEALKWHWDSRTAFLRGEKPDYFAYFPIWSRGNGKTTLLRALIVADACLSITANKPSYALIVGGTKKKAKGTAVTISQMLTLPSIKEYYPQLAQVKETDQGQSQGWTADFIYTAANAVFNFIGLDEGVAGTNVADVRPTLIAPDDIDDREDSPVISENRFQTFTRAVLPTRQHNTLVFFAQNLISRYSTMYRIYTQQERVLTNRKPTDPVPAVVGLETTQQTVGGIIKDVVTQGRPTWKKWDLARVQEEIDTYGLSAFLRECNHEVEQSKEGLILHNYDDDVHVITESEFLAIYPSGWKGFAKWPFNDWARTKTKYHANVAGYVTVSSANTALPGITFIMHPMSFPPNSLPEDVGERLLSVLRQPTTPAGAVEALTWKSLIRDSLHRANAGQHTDTFERRLAYEREYLSRIIPQYASPILTEYNVRAGVMSHSEDTVRDVFNTVFGFGFQPSNPGKNDAIEDINRAMRVDYTEKHPFRDQMGYSRLFIVVPDHKREYRYALRPDDLHDHDLIRYQFKNWRHQDPRLTVTGETIDDPLKLNDDFGQSLQMVYFSKILTNIALNKVERIEATLAEKGLAWDEIVKIESEAEKLATIQTRMLQQQALNKPKEVRYPRVSVRRGR